MLISILHSSTTYSNITYMFLCTILVFLMTPGLAFFYGGLVRKKNSLAIMWKVFSAIGVVGLMWIFGGFSLVFGNDLGGFIGNPIQFFALHNVIFSIDGKYGASIPLLMFFMYQLMFAIITLPLMTGATAGRMNMGGWIGFLICWMILVYFPVAHWIWGGGFLAKWGFVDFAGGTVIHITAAFSGLMAIWYFGRRKDYDECPEPEPSNLGLVAIGAGMLMFGWFGFNAGGTLASNDIAAIAFANTGIAMICAMVVWCILDYSFNTHHWSFAQLMTGPIAGAAAVTPASGYVTPVGAIIIGFCAAVVCYFCVWLAKKLKWDDTLGVWGVHGMGGFLGTILIGCLADPRVNGVKAGGYQFLVQLSGALLVAAYSMLVTWLILAILDHIFHIRTTKEQMDRGLDPALLHERYFVDSDVEDAKKAELAEEAMEEVPASPVSPQNE